MITLSVQNEIIVCPDCGQRFDPAKAASTARVPSYRGNGPPKWIKPGRVEAQDVRTAAHRTGRHHRAHVVATARALDGWAQLSDGLRWGAARFAVPVETERVDAAVALRFVRVDDLESLLIEYDEGRSERLLGERIARAVRAVRVDYPWWRAYLHELGVSSDEVAAGLTVGQRNRGDVLFEQHPQAVQMPGITLRGLL